MQTDCYIFKVHFKHTYTNNENTSNLSKKNIKIFTLIYISYSKRTVRKILNWIHIAQQEKKTDPVSSMTIYQVIFQTTI